MTGPSGQPEHHPDTSGCRLWSVAGAVVALIGATLLAYANSFPGTFFFDDEAAIVNNASIRNLGAWRQVLWPPIGAGVGGRPFANLTFALNYAISGNDAWSYHAGNFAIHLLAAILLFFLIRRTLLGPSLRERFSASATLIASAASFLWALHPVQTSIVDYASQRTEGLAAALYVATLYCFARGVEKRSAGWMVASWVACVLGMSSKETMVTAPVMVLLYDRTFLSGTFAASLRRHWRVHAALAGTWILLAVLMYYSKPSERGVGFDLGQTWWSYALTECGSVLRYLKLSLWPDRLIFDYGALYQQQIVEGIACLGPLAAALAWTVVALWRRPALGFAAAWFFILLAPSSSVVPVAQQPCAENRMYLPIAGVLVLLVTLSFAAVGRRALWACIVGALAFGLATAARNPAFRSELIIWSDTVAKRPENPRAENNLGNALLKLDRNDEGLVHIEAALKLSPTYSDAHNNRGVVLLRKGRFEDAVAEFKLALKSNPNYADAHYNLGEAYLQLGRTNDALSALETSLKLNPDNPKACNNYGIALLDLGRVEESMVAEQKALTLNPNMPEAHYNLGNSLLRAGSFTAAITEYDKTLTLDPRFAKADNNAGVALLRMGKLSEAAERFEAALRIKPDYTEARRNLELVTPQRK